jgi:hypothetical protein
MNARPVFLKWSAAVFVVLLPFLAYSVWDVIEAASLRSKVQAIARPTPSSATGDAALAERYYHAASALVSWDEAETSAVARNGMWNVMRGKADWTPVVMAAARHRLDQNREALEFADRASALPFVRTGAPRYFTHKVGDAGQLMMLGQLCELRAMVRATDGDSSGTVAALYSEARLGRAMEDAFDGMFSYDLLPFFFSLAPALQRAKPPASSLEPLAASLAALDRDDRTKTQLMRFRVAVIDGVPLSRPPAWMPEALLTHLTVRSLDVLTELIAVSELPWPARLDAVTAVGEYPVPTLWARGERGRRQLKEFAQVNAEQVKRIRCARLTIDGRLNLVDPFSGKRLEIGSCHL